MKWHGLRIFLLAGMTVSTLAGCQPRQASNGGLTCFPPDAARWIKIAATGAAALPTTGGQATIYVDRSGSMLGYVDGASVLDRPFQDLIGTLPDSLDDIGMTTQYRAFGRAVSDVLPDGRKRLQTADFYRCAASDARTCDNQESHLDEVFGKIASDTTGMSVVLTDLWFTNSEIQTSGVAALKPQLETILAGGRTVAVYGIDAPFAGRIYDLPDTASIPYRGRHPLFMIVVGSKVQVVAFGEQLKRSGSHHLAEAAANGDMNRALFTLDPTSADSRKASPVTATGNPALTPDIFEATDGIVLQQFGLRRTLPARGNPPVATWSGPDKASFIDNAVWSGPLTAKTRIWKRRTPACSAAAWIEQAPLTEGWSDAGDGRHRLALDPAVLSARLTGPGSVYLVSGELTRTSVDSPNPNDAWMRSEWNLPPDKASAVAAIQPPLFPTLNLSEVARLMEDALASAAERKGSTVDGFSILVKVEK